MLRSLTSLCCVRSSIESSLNKSRSSSSVTDANGKLDKLTGYTGPSEGCSQFCKVFKLFTCSFRTFDMVSVVSRTT